MALLDGILEKLLMQFPSQPILIEWLDSEAETGWRYIDNIEPQGSVITSIGFLLKENDTAIVISTSISTNRGAIDPLTIPKCAILNRSDFPDVKT
jgi:hypothetical protein